MIELSIGINVKVVLSKIDKGGASRINIPMNYLKIVIKLSILKNGSIWWLEIKEHKEFGRYQIDFYSINNIHSKRRKMDTP